MVTQSEIKNFIENNYGSIYKTSGGGRTQFGGQNVKSWLKKLLGNRVFDLYVKYLGVKTLTTATLVPIGLILSRDFLENFMKNDDQVGGSLLDMKLPILDNPLVGTYLKLAGLSLLKLNLNTLVPLGTAMVIYDLSLKHMIGGTSCVQNGGSSVITGASIPVGFVQKVNYGITGRTSPEPLVHIFRKMGENNPYLQQECASGSCAKNVYTSANPHWTEKHFVKGFPSLGIDAQVSTSKWSGQLLSYEEPRIPSAMAGGARRKKNQKGKGSDWMASQYSRGPVNSPTMKQGQFRAFNKSSQLIDNSQFTGKNMAANTPLVIETPLYAQNHLVQGVSTSQFAGNLEPNELFKEQRVEYGVPTSQFGGDRLNQILDHLENNNNDRRKLVTCLTNECKKYNLMNNEESKELRRQAKDKRYSTINILNQFPTKILENELENNHKH